MMGFENNLRIGKKESFNMRQFKRLVAKKHGYNLLVNSDNKKVVAREVAIFCSRCKSFNIISGAGYAFCPDCNFLDVKW